MRILACIALLCLVASLRGAPVPKELKVPSDAEKLQGVWIVVKGEPGSKGYRWTFEGEKLFAGGTADTKGIEYGFVIQPDASPREMDFGGNGRLSYRGIYKFVGDELHIVYHGSDRPTEFSAAVGGRHQDVMRRFVEEDK